MPPVSSVTVSESNGLTFLDVDNAFASARISLFGGHILSYVPKSDGRERLWVSPHAYLNGERPIAVVFRCWPCLHHGRQRCLPSRLFENKVEADSFRR